MPKKGRGGAFPKEKNTTPNLHRRKSEGTPKEQRRKNDLFSLPRKLQNSHFVENFSAKTHFCSIFYFSPSMHYHQNRLCIFRNKKPILLKI